MRRSKGIYERRYKRPLDIVIAVTALTILFPFFLLLALLVRLKLGSPIFFKQKRPGLNEKIFTMYKFRSMTDKRNKKGELLPDEQRLTTFGKILRSTSLDELPELINVLKGEMAIVGPRPQLVKDMVFMNETQRQRHLILPGITGEAQVSGRNNLSWEQKINIDLNYLENINLLNDIKIIFRTFKKVVFREDVNTSGIATAEDYGDYLLREKKISFKEYASAIKDSEELIKRSRKCRWE